MNDQPYIYFNKPSHYNGSIRFELSYVPTRNVMISCTFAKVALGLAIPATIWKIEDNLYMHITISTYLKQIDPASGSAIDWSGPSEEQKIEIINDCIRAIVLNNLTYLNEASSFCVESLESLIEQYSPEHIGILYEEYFKAKAL